MYQKKIKVSLDCGLHLFREVVNGKWKLNLILFIHEGIKRPGELKRKIPGTTRRVLDTQLNQLVKHGLLRKTIYEGLPLKVEYELTDLCLPLIPIINSIVMWGEDNSDELKNLIENSQ